MMFLGLFDLNPTASGKYIINASTAPKWIGAIANLLDNLRQIFQYESKDSKENVLNKVRVRAVSTFTYTLYMIFCIRELQDLFGLNSLKEITPEKNSPDGYCNNTAKKSVEADQGEFSFFNFLTSSSSEGY